MLHTRAVLTQRDFVGKFLDVKEVQCNKFLGRGDTKLDIYTTIMKWAVSMETIVPCEFLKAGCKIMAHEKPAKRRTWSPHGQQGYSLGPAMHHYRCQNVYISPTASERIVDTLEFFPHNSPMPQLSSTDILIMAANDMTNALKILNLMFHSPTSGMTQ
jgi:hypothetical protein